MYEQQIERARRYYKRFQEINDGLQGSAPSSEVYIDDIHAFFNVCYHIKDYLKNDPKFTKYSNQQIENFISNTPVLALCADICNGQKHMVFSSPPRSGDIPSFGKRTFWVEVIHSLSGESSQQTLKIQQQIDHAGKKHDAFTIATEAMAAWENFLK